MVASATTKYQHLIRLLTHLYDVIPLAAVGGPQCFMFDDSVSLAIISDYVTDSGKKNL